MMFVKESAVFYRVCYLLILSVKNLLSVGFTLFSFLLNFLGIMLLKLVNILVFMSEIKGCLIFLIKNKLK